jgi:hypothetical protein
MTQLKIQLEKITTMAAKVQLEKITTIMTGTNIKTDLLIVYWHFLEL